MTEQAIENLTKDQRTLRYAISVDIEAGMEMGATLEEAIDWFTTQECAEIYELQDGLTTSGEILIDVVNEVVSRYYN